MRKKLAASRGETLVETLVAILIIGLVSAGLAAMISAAAKMNGTAADLDQQIYEAVTTAEQKVPDPDFLVGTQPAVKVTVGTLPETAIDVVVYGKDKNRSYALAPESREVSP